MNARILASLAVGTMMLGACAEPAPAPAPQREVSVKPPRKVGDVWFLDQAWSDAQRDWYYSATQGSQIMPYDWFMALPDPEVEPPADASGSYLHKNLARFGYLEGSGNSWNPDALPVGLSKDTDLKGAGWIGLTCAACHTSEIRVGADVMRIDGAGAKADFHAFLSAIDLAVQQALTDAYFPIFAERVLGPRATVAQRSKLKVDLRDFGSRYATFVWQSTPPNPWGATRLDAFQMIFNRVSVVDLGIPSNNRLPDAPVSYPHLWDAPLQPRVQWNGFADNNSKLDTVARGQALGRNAGEVLGVFGKTTLAKPTKEHWYYDSSVNVKNLIWMEDQLRTLRSPVWPDAIAGAVDMDKAAAGKSIYEVNCSSCHQILDRDKPVDNAPIEMVPLFNWPTDNSMTIKAFNSMCVQGVEAAVSQGLVSVHYGTDPTMAVAAACRKVQTGPLAGVSMPAILGTPLKDTDTAVNLLKNAVAGVVIGRLLDEPDAMRTLLNPNWMSPLDAPSSWSGPAPTPTGRSRATAEREGRLASEQSFTNPAPGDEKSRVALDIAQQLETLYRDNAVTTAAPSMPEGAAPSATPGLSRDQEKKLATAIRSLLAYKARPLDGIWATAPYLHNGSVPNLHELLLPAGQRTVQVPLGTASFDPVKVGVDMSAGDNGFVLDTTKPGNRNTGHEYGAQLGEQERWFLIEYLKTL